MHTSDALFADGKFAELWQRRASLTPDEMVVMYTVVHGTLKTYHPFELRALADDKEELVSQFIYRKVFRLEAEQDLPETFPIHSTPTTVRAVCAYFRRYLIDCLRRAEHHRNELLIDDDMFGKTERPTFDCGDPIHSVLVQYGLDETAVRDLATQFIETLDESDRLLLAGSLGWLSNEKGGLAAIAERYGIASHHYRARKLGLTARKSSLPGDFAGTRIGQWIGCVLGIDIATENRSAILLALGILSDESRAPD